jgi:hypothetical protein
MITFRRFMKDRPFNASLQEGEAAPVAGSESPAQGTSTTDQHHFGALDREFADMDSEEAYMSQGAEANQVPAYPNWPFRVTPPLPISFKKVSDGREGQGEAVYEVTYHLAEKYKHEPQKFVKPHKEGEPVYQYVPPQNAPVQDQTVVMNQDQLSSLIAKPLAQGGGMGGAPPMGGGMDPMGGGAPPPPGGMM